MATDIPTILNAASLMLGQQPIARDAARTFYKHDAATPLESSSAKGIEAFEILAENRSMLDGFGVAGEKEMQFFMVVKVGHGPFSRDYERENFAVTDAHIIEDTIVNQQWWPAGTRQIWYEGHELDKTNANWWLSRVKFRVVYMESIVALVSS